MAIVIDISSLSSTEADLGYQIYKSIDDKRPDHVKLSLAKSKQAVHEILADNSTVIVVRPSIQYDTAYLSHTLATGRICLHGYGMTQPEYPGVVYIPHKGSLSTITQYTIRALTLATSYDALVAATSAMKRSIAASKISTCIVNCICSNARLTKQREPDHRALDYYRLHMAYMHAKKELAVQTEAAEIGARNQVGTYEWFYYCAKAF